MRKMLMIFLLSAGASAYCQNAGHKFVWDDTCYCEYSVLHPANVAWADNNMDILLALRKGMTLQELSEAVDHTRSQVLLLLSQELIRKEDGIFITAIPLIDSTATIRLRGLAEGISRNMMPDIEGECRSYIASLDDMKMSGSAFSLLFSYIIDGITWDMMDESGITDYPEREGSWNGYYWFVSPPRKTSFGTNTYGSGGDASISVTWSPLENKVCDEIWEKDILEYLLTEVENNGYVRDHKKYPALKDLGLIDGKGKVLIPVVSQGSDIAVSSEAVARTIVDSFMRNADLRAVQKEFNLESPAEAAIILFHEVMWDLLSELDASGIISAPSILSGGGVRKDVANLCVITY